MSNWWVGWRPHADRVTANAFSDIHASCREEIAHLQEAMLGLIERCDTLEGENAALAKEAIGMKAAWMDVRARLCYVNPDGSHIRGCAQHEAQHPAQWCEAKQQPVIHMHYGTGPLADSPLGHINCGCPRDDL